MKYVKIQVKNTKLQYIVTDGKDVERVYTIAPLYNRVTITEALDSRTVELVNSYIKEYGIIDRYIEALDKVSDDILNIEPVHTIQASFRELIDLFPYEQIMDLIRSQRYVTPSDIYDKVDSYKADNALITTEQTYTINQYYDLLVLTTLVKAILPVTAMYYVVILDGQTRMEHKLLDIFADSWVEYHPAIEKLNSFITAHASSIITKRTSKMDEALEKIAYRKRLEPDDIYKVVLVDILFRRLSITPISKTDRSENIIKRAYSAITTVFGANNNSQLKDNINIRSGAGLDETGADNYSKLENYRQSSDTTLAGAEEYKLLNNPEYFLMHYNKTPSIVFQDAYKAFTTWERTGQAIPQFSLDILAIVLMPVISSDALKLLDRDTLITVSAGCYQVLYEDGFKHIANLVAVRRDTLGDEVRSRPPIRWASDDVLKQLAEEYPVNGYKTKNKKIDTGDDAKDALNSIVKNIINYDFLYLMPKKYIQGYTKHVEPASDIKTQIGEMILHIANTYM